MNPGADEPDAVPLTGGRLTAGVVRVGDTVRRPSQPSSRFTAALLAHLHERGFAGAPRWLGQDEQGRDILSYLPGWVPANWQRFTDEQVHLAGVLLRAFHDATRGSSLVGSCPVVCHNDPGPNNVVFQEGRPLALIDFDLAAPGDPLSDLGYMAWSWCVSSRPDRQPVEAQAVQVRVLADSCGLEADDRRGLSGAILERQAWNMRFWQSRRESSPPERLAGIDEIIAWSARELSFTEENRTMFDRRLISAIPQK